MINMLFTCVGRRVELIQKFRQAAEAMKTDIWIGGTDIRKDAPALYFCDEKFMTSNINDKDYIPNLLLICREKKINIIIPTIDTDLLILSKSKRQFDEIGTKVLVSSVEMIHMCRDKRYTSLLFDRSQVLSPKTTDNAQFYNGPFPCFIKPQNGSSSINAFKVSTKEELNFYVKKIDNYIIQPYIEGQEYTVDIFCDFVGNPITIVPRKRVAVRGGEVLKTEICMDAKIIEQCEKVIAVFKPYGPLTIQLIREAKTGNDYFIEINPRFGGGSPLSMDAGANSAYVLLNLLENNYFDKTILKVKNNLEFSRFDQNIQIPNDTLIVKKLTEYIPDEHIKAIILDLDDTLYDEKDYIVSGFHKVAELFPEYPDFFQVLYENFNSKNLVFNSTLKKFSIYDKGTLLKCLETYRKHIPEIALKEEVRKKLLEWKTNDIFLGIITDGRPEGQKNKLKALELDKIVNEILITDELGGLQFRKPCDIAFRIMQKRANIPFSQMVYIGDNKEKDISAPQILGMRTVLVKNTNGLYTER